jgi:hypothetical protein
MKNILSLLLICCFFAPVLQAQTAPDFTATDCDGNTHNLYAELDAGKVIVLTWVMPCGGCVAGANTAYNVVQSYASPDVLFYLIDDVGDITCSALYNWALASGLGFYRCDFSTSAITESNYGGSSGMPHVTVVGGTSHQMYWTGLNAAANDATAIQNAIDAALLTGIKENKGGKFNLTVLPLSSKSIQVSYAVSESAAMTLEVFNTTGQVINRIDLGKQQLGRHTKDIDMTPYSNGIYFVRLSTDAHSQTAKFSFAD